MTSKVYMVTAEHDDGGELPLPRKTFPFKTEAEAKKFIKVVRKRKDMEAWLDRTTTRVFSSVKDAQAAFVEFVGEEEE